VAEAECFVVDRTPLQVEQEFEGADLGVLYQNRSDAILTGEGDTGNRGDEFWSRSHAVMHEPKE
jgi:hypothetical protein